MKKTIVWEKWRDNEHYIETTQSIETDMNTPQLGEDDIEEMDEMEVMGNIGVTIYPHVIRTPLGEYSVLDHNLPSKMFDCWVGHTNFPITHNILHILNEQTNGVECLRVMSKYRFFIGIGKLFKFRDVANEINHLLCKDIEILTEQDVREIMSHNKEIVRWAAVLLDSGGFQYISTKEENDENFDLELKEFKKQKGKIIEG